MKIAVTSENNEIFQHFGHTPGFAVFTAEDKVITDEKYLASGDSGHGALAALLAAEEDESRLEGVTKDLYPELARRFGTSPGNRERCIRSAIERAWREGDGAAREEWFGPELAPMLGKRPGNARFLKLMLERLKKTRL